MSDIEIKIISVIDKIRPFLLSDGGNIEFVKFENGIVYVRLLGSCANCMYVDNTIEDGVEMTLINEIPEVVKVEVIK